MIDYIRNCLKPKYNTLNTIYIHKANLLANLELLENELKGKELIPVLKANAYGHGLVEVCKILNKTDIKMIAVDSFPEAQIARKYFSKKILLLNELPLKAYSYCNLNKVEFCVYNKNTIEFLSRKYGKKIKIHLFLNTGMNREGIRDVDDFLRQSVDDLRKVSLVALCSHLIASENEDNNKQEEIFSKYINKFKEMGFNNFKTHLSNSGGIFTLKKEYDSYRAGISFYGYNILSNDDEKNSLVNNLKPALRVVSTITSKQIIKKGEVVSYSFSYRTKEDKLIVIIPFGYYEGLSRKLSNKAKFKVMLNSGEEVYARIAGSVCMNLSCLELDVSLKDKVNIGDKVEIISLNKNEYNSVNNLAKEEGTIDYEIITRLRGNIRREVV
ncbi:alanine racemase [bacterium]|nr:alanine racemase [bacterium]